MPLSLVNWNVEWATRGSPRSVEIRRRIERHDPEIVCLTEAVIGLSPGDGHTICSQEDYGYPIREGRRKVQLWSKRPWERVDDVGDRSMPPGRFVAGVTDTSIGQVTVIGICIPWSGSRVRDSEDGRKMWEDHRDYLVGLDSVLSRPLPDRLIVMGDFNQRISQRGYTPVELRMALSRAIPDGMTTATSTLGHQGRRSIDHIVLTDDLVAESLGVISNMNGARRLSDHFGIFAEVSARDET